MCKEKQSTKTQNGRRGRQVRRKPACCWGVYHVANVQLAPQGNQTDIEIQPQFCANTQNKEGRSRRRETGGRECFALPLLHYASACSAPLAADGGENGSVKDVRQLTHPGIFSLHSSTASFAVPLSGLSQTASPL